MKEFIAFCGLDCETCEARIATTTNDNELRVKVAKEWSKLNGVEITPEMINCVGCRLNGKKTPFCESICQIRQCGLAKGYKTCGDFADMEKCKKLRMIIKNNPGAFQNLRTGNQIEIR